LEISKPAWPGWAIAGAVEDPGGLDGMAGLMRRWHGIPVMPRGPLDAAVLAAAEVEGSGFVVLADVAGQVLTLYPPEPRPPRLAAVYTPRWFTGADLPRAAAEPGRQGGRFRRWVARAYRWAARR
jgi:hypothetical protein